MKLFFSLHSILLVFRNYQLSISLIANSVTLKYYSHLDLAYTKGLAVQLLKSVQNEHRNLYDRWSEDCCWEDFFLSANTYNRTTQHEESYKREHAETWRLVQNLLYIFVMNWDNLTSTTSVDTAISTSAVATSSSSQESVNCTNSLTLKQLIAAMSVNWHSKQCLSDSLRFEGKRVEFRPWLQQIVAKLNVNMSDNNASVQFDTYTVGLKGWL
jgi:hypothetical protein